MLLLLPSHLLNHQLHLLQRPALLLLADDQVLLSTGLIGPPAENLRFCVHLHAGLEAAWSLVALDDRFWVARRPVGEVRYVAAVLPLKVPAGVAVPGAQPDIVYGGLLREEVTGEEGLLFWAVDGRQFGVFIGGTGLLGVGKGLESGAIKQFDALVVLVGGPVAAVIFSCNVNKTMT